jgi:hypothetical protein
MFCDQAMAIECSTLSAALSAVEMPKAISAVSDAVSATFEDLLQSILSMGFC